MRELRSTKKKSVNKVASVIYLQSDIHLKLVDCRSSIDQSTITLNSSTMTRQEELFLSV